MLPSFLLRIYASMEKSKQQIQQRPGKRIFASIVSYPGDYQADVVFFSNSESSKLRRENDGNTCMLLAVEPATRFAWAAPMKNKSSQEIIKAFDKLYERMGNDPGREDSKHSMHTLTTDFGVEFTNREFQRHLKERDILHRIKSPNDHYSMAILDRTVATLKRWIENWQEANESLSWVDALPEILVKFNRHKVSIAKSQANSKQILKVSPYAAREDDKLVERIYEYDLQRGTHGRAHADKLKAGDKVRIREVPSFKGAQRWSHKVYTILQRHGLAFDLEHDGEKLLYSYRAHDLLKVPDDSVDVPDIMQKPRQQAKRVRRRRQKKRI